MTLLSKRREESLSVYGTINNCLFESQSKENSLMQQERQVKNTVISISDIILLALSYKFVPP